MKMLRSKIATNNGSSSDIFSNRNKLNLLVVIIGLVVMQSDKVRAVRNTNFISVPTQVKAYENSTVVLPCLYNGNFF